MYERAACWRPSPAPRRRTSPAQGWTHQPQSQYCAWLVMLSVIVLTRETAANPIGKAPWISPPTKPRRSFGTVSSASLPKGWVVARFLNC